MNARFSRTALAGLVALTLGAGMAPSGNAQAHDWDEDHEHHDGWHHGHGHHRYYAPRYYSYPGPIIYRPAPRVYYAPPPVYYYSPEPYYYPREYGSVGLSLNYNLLF